MTESPLLKDKPTISRVRIHWYHQDKETGNWELNVNSINVDGKLIGIEIE